MPTLAEVHRNALNGGDQYGTWHTCPVGTMRASWALNKAWHRMHSMALSQARSAEALPTWYQNSRGSLEGLADVGERAQRLISKTINRKVVQDYKRHIAGDARVEGALNRAKGAGEGGFAAQPWMPDGTLDLGHHHMLVSILNRLGLELPEAWQGHDHPNADARDKWGYWISGAQASGSSGVWDATHNLVQVALWKMMASAGCVGITYEDHTWDMGVAESNTRRRPDLVCRLPTSGRKIVVDVVGKWSHVLHPAPNLQAPGEGAKWAEKGKEGRYRRSYARKLAVEHGEDNVDDHMVTEAMRDFYAAGFESTGALGPRLQALIEVLAAEAKVQPTGADLYHWSAMAFKRHWKQRIGAAIMRGHAYAVTREGVKARGYHEAPAHAREACTIDGLF